MSWLTKVRNSLSFVQKRDTTDTLWIKCPGCSEMLFIKEYQDNLSVCPRCQHHGRIRLVVSKPGVGGCGDVCVLRIQP